MSGAEISVSSFNLVREASAPTKLKLARDTNESVRTQRNLVHPETAAPLLPTEMELYQTFGDRPLYMTPDEVKAAKKMGLQPGLKLMGFRKIQDLKFGDFVSGGTFIYPEEGIVKVWPLLTHFDSLGITLRVIIIVTRYFGFFCSFFLISVRICYS